jgi:hypothetical protein
MRHHNSIFHALLKHVPWAAFARLVDRHQADRRVRRLNSKSQFVALLFGQLAGATSLREVWRAIPRGFTMPADAARRARRWPTPTRDGRQTFTPICSPIWRPARAGRPAGISRTR